MIRPDVVSSLSPVHSSVGLRICGQKHAFSTCTSTLKSKAYVQLAFCAHGEGKFLQTSIVYVSVPHLSVVMTGLVEVKKIARI